MTKWFLWAALAICVATAAFAQNQTIKQSGTVTSTHVSCWTYQGIVQDCSNSTTPFATAFGVYGTGTPFCVLDVQVTAATIHTTPNHQLCLGYSLDDSAANLSLNAYNGAAQIPFNLVINGTTIPIGGSNWLSGAFDQQFGSAVGDVLCRGTSAWVALGAGSPGQFLTTNGTSGCPQWTTPGSSTTPLLRAITSGTTDTASTTDGTIAWASASASSKTETLFACNSGNNGRVLYIKDAQGNAGTYPISIVTTGGNTIDGGSSYAIVFNYQSITLQCYGAANKWLTL